MDVSSAIDGRMSDLVKGSYGLKQVYESHNQIGNSMKSDTQESLIAELGNALNAILHVKDAQIHLSGCISPPARDESRSSEINTNQPELLITTSRKSLSKSPGICSQNATSVVCFDDTKDEVYDNTSQHQKDQNSENLPLKHPPPLSVPKKLVSALKGTREKAGTPPKKLSVTWASDVYDPPVTSVSHSLKNHSQQRSRSKKHNKRQKGKSSQGSSSSSGKRYHKHHGKSDHHHHHSKPSSSPPSPGTPIFGNYKSTLELLDFSVAGNDTKCGSSFLRSSLAEVHNIPVAEAT